MAAALLSVPLFLAAYLVYQQYDYNDPEGRVASVKVSIDISLDIIREMK